MNIQQLLRTINSIHLDQIDLTDPTQWIQWTLSLFSKTIRYLYHNITLPRVSPEYQDRDVSIFPELPSRQDVVVGIWEILASVHPNYYAIALMFVCVGIFAYIKIRYPFWNTQPVVHIYDWYRRWIQTTPGILQKYPFKTRFYDTTKQIQTIDFSHIPKPTHDESKQLKQICEFIQSNYIPTDRLLSTITEKVLSLYLSGHNAPSYISIHRELDQTITGVCTSRLVNWFMSESMTADGSLETPLATHIGSYWEKTGVRNERRFSSNNMRCVAIECYYLDYMTVRRETETRIAERLFQTHEYNIRIANPTIAVSMFQKDGEPCEGVVPFMQYNTYTFYMRNLPVDPLPPDFIISRVAKENADMLHDIYHILTTPTPETLNRRMWTMCLLPDIGHIRELLVTQQMYLFCLKKGGHLYGAYFFKDMNINYEDVDGKTLGLVASIQNTDSIDLFMSGFMESLRQILHQAGKSKRADPNRLLKEMGQYKMMMIRNTGHNTYILDKWREYHHTILDTPNSVYLYNYMLPKMPVSNRDIFML